MLINNAGVMAPPTRMTTADGSVYAFGDATGDPSPGQPQAHDLGGLDATGIVSTPTDFGYWLVDEGGFVHPTGNAVLYPLN